MVSEKFDFSRKSDKCVVYSDFNSRKSHLYIHQWRIPPVLPKSILVTLNFKGNFVPEKVLLYKDFLRDPNLKYEPIIRTVCWTQDNGNGTVRFDTKLYVSEREPPFPTIYIPEHMLKGHTQDKFVQVVIDWDFKE